MIVTTRVLDLEEKLAQDADGSYRDGLCDSLRNELTNVKRQISAGLPPDEFQEAGKYQAALESAISVVERAWQIEHGAQ